MPIYLTLTGLTDQGTKTIRENPDRIKEVNKEVELMGVKVLTQYALLGPYDFVNIIEAPSDEIAAKLAINLSSGHRPYVDTNCHACRQAYRNPEEEPPSWIRIGDSDIHR